MQQCCSTNLSRFSPTTKLSSELTAVVLSVPGMELKHSLDKAKLQVVRIIFDR